MSSQLVPESSALPANEFFGVARGELKAKLKQRRLSRSQGLNSAAAATPRKNNNIEEEEIMLLGDTSAASSSSAAAAASSASASAHAGASPSSATPSAAATKPIGFHADEDFISLQFDDLPEVSPTATPATKGVKRKSFGDDAAAAESNAESDTTAEVLNANSKLRVEGPYRAPWATRDYSAAPGVAGSNFTLQLHEEILDFCKHVTPKPQEEAMRADLVERVRAIVREAFPHAPNVKLQAFGSYATKLYLPISDIDFVLTGVDTNYAQAPSMDKGRNSALAILERTMRAKQNASYLEHISGARIPILKFTDKATNIKVDICYEVEGGLRAAEYIVQMQQQLPALRPLTLFLKYFLHCRILNDTYKGGIGSFMLQLMLINHLQQLNYLGKLHQPTTNLGMILMSFLECYGVSLNYKNAGLNTNWDSKSASSKKSAYFNKSAKGWVNPNRPHLLSIENPLDASHDVGSNSYLIMRVRKALQFAYFTLCSVVHYEAQAKSRGERPSKKQRVDLTKSADSDYPFKDPSHVPMTLLSNILSYNDDLRPGQEEVEYDEMEQELQSVAAAKLQREKHVHVIESSEDEGDASSPDDEVPQVINHKSATSFGAINLTEDSPAGSEAESEPTSSSDSDDEEPAGRSDAVSKFEKRFGVDMDDDDEEDNAGAEESEDDESNDSDSSVDPEDLSSSASEEDSEDEYGSDDNDDDDDDESAMDIDLSDAEYDNGEKFSHKKRHQNGNHNFHNNKQNHQRSTPPGDFIPLSSGFGQSRIPSAPSHSFKNSNKKKKNKKSPHYDFSSSPHPSNTVHKKAKSKSKKKNLIQGTRTEGKYPNNQLYESKKQQKQKARAKKMKHQQKKKHKYL